jgi:hypothetical protein
MNNNFPVDFKNKVKNGKTSNPIKAADLMENFVWAKLIVDESLTEKTTSMGFSAFKLKIPAVPKSGTYVLGAVSGGLEWIKTEKC